MTSPQDRPPAIERFYVRLDERIAGELTPEQKEGMEKALLATALTLRHQIDIRKSFPSSSKRYYPAFLFGGDLRHQHRQGSILSRMLFASLLLIAVLFATCCMLPTLYMIRPALGIDMFQNFHIGIWDWWLSLRDRQRQRIGGGRYCDET